MCSVQSVTYVPTRSDLAGRAPLWGGIVRNRSAAGAERAHQRLGRRPARSRASSPGETPAGDDYQKNLSSALWRRLPKKLVQCLRPATTAKKLVYGLRRSLTMV